MSEPAPTWPVVAAYIFFLLTLAVISVLFGSRP